MTQEQKQKIHNSPEITLDQLKKKHPKIKSELEKDSELSELVSRSPIIMQRLDAAPSLIGLIRETPENKALLEASFLDEIPPADLHFQLNKLQEIKFVVESYFDSIMDCPIDEKTQKNLPALSAEQKLKALDAVLATQITDQKELEKWGVWPSINALREMLQHQEPQNRCDFGNGFGRREPRTDGWKKQIYYALSGHDFHRLLKPEDIKKLKDTPPASRAGETIKGDYIQKIWPQGLTFTNGYRIKTKDIAMIKPDYIKPGDQSEAFHGWENEGRFGLTAQQTPTYCMTKKPIVGYLQLMVEQCKDQINEELGIQQGVKCAFAPLLKRSYLDYDQASWGGNYLFHFQLVQDPSFDDPGNISRLLCHQASLPPNKIQNVSKLISHLEKVTFDEKEWDSRKSSVVDLGKKLLDFKIEGQKFTDTCEPHEKNFYIFALSQRSKKDQLAFWAQPEREVQLKALITYLRAKREKKSLQGLWEYNVLIHAQEARAEQMTKKQFAELDDDERSAMMAHLLTCPPLQRWLACNNQSAQSVEALQKYCSEEKESGSSSMQELVKDLDLVQSTPQLFKKSYTVLSIDQRKQFIWKLLQLDQAGRCEVLAEQTKLSENYHDFNSDVQSMQSWLGQSGSGREQASQEIRALQRDFFVLVQQSRNAVQLIREVQAFEKASLAFKDNSCISPSIMRHVPMLDNELERPAFISMLLRADEKTIRRVIRQVFVYYPQIFEALKRGSMVPGVTEMYARVFSATYPVLSEEFRALSEVQKLHAKPYDKLTEKEQEQFLIGLLGIADYKQRLVILNRQRKFGLQSITALTGKIIKKSPYSIQVLSDLIDNSQVNVEISNRRQDIVAEINLINKTFWPLLGEEQKAAGTVSTYYAQDFRFPSFNPDAMKKSQDTLQYVHTVGYQELVQLQIIIDLLGRGSIKRKEILRYQGETYCQQVRNVLVSLLKDSSMRNYLSQFGSVTAFQATLDKILGMSSSSVSAESTSDLSHSVLFLSEDSKRVGQVAKKTDVDAFRKQIAQDLPLLMGVSEVESVSVQQKIRAARVVRYFHTFCTAQDDALLFSLIPETKEEKASHSSQSFTWEEFRKLASFIRENDLHHLDVIDQLAVIAQLKKFPARKAPDSASIQDSKTSVTGPPIKVEDISYSLWEDPQFADGNLGWNDVFEKITMEQGNTEIAAVCRITGKREYQEDRVTARPLSLSASSLSQEELKAVLLKTYKQIQERCGQDQLVGTTACTTISQRSPADNGKNEDVISTVTAQLGDSYSFAVIKEKNKPLVVRPLVPAIHTLSNPYELSRVGEFLHKQGKIEDGTSVAVPGERRLGSERLRLKEAQETKETKASEAKKRGIVPSRCFGQRAFEQDGLSHEPEIFLEQFTVPAGTEVFIVNLTDGVIESPQSVKKYGEKNLPPDKAAVELQQMLTGSAESLGAAAMVQGIAAKAVKHSKDNMSLSSVKVTAAPWVSFAGDGCGGSQTAETVVQCMVPLLNQNIEAACRNKHSPLPVITVSSESLVSVGPPTDSEESKSMRDKNEQEDKIKALVETHEQQVHKLSSINAKISKQLEEQKQEHSAFRDQMDAIMTQFQKELDDYESERKRVEQNYRNEREKTSALEARLQNRSTVNGELQEQLNGLQSANEAKSRVAPKVQALYYLGNGLFGCAAGTVISAYLLDSKLDFPLGKELSVVAGMVLGCLVAYLVDRKFHITDKMSQSCLPGASSMTSAA